MVKNKIFYIAIGVIPLLFSMVVHEVAHGWAAYKLGDSTAKDAGRLTLNPIAHLDPMMSVVVPLLSYFLAGVFFGGWSMIQRKLGRSKPVTRHSGS